MSQTTNLELPEISSGQSQKEITANDAIFALEANLSEKVSISLTSVSSPYTLTYDSAEGGDKTAIRFIYLKYTGTLTAAMTVLVPVNKHLFFCENATTGGFDITVKVSGQTGVVVPNGTTRLIYVNGTDASFIINERVTSVFGRTGAVVAAEGDYTLTQLSDVTITSPTTGDRLKYNGSAWVNGVTTLDDLSDAVITSPATGDKLAYNGTNWVNQAFRGAQVHTSANVSIPDSTSTAVAFNTEDYDTSTIHDNVTNNTRLTVPSGVTKIRLSAGVKWANNATGRRSIVLNKNGAAFQGQGAMTVDAGASINHELNVTTGVIAVSAADYFEVIAFQDSGGALNVLSNESTWFSMEIVC